MPEPRDTLLLLARDIPVALDFVRSAPYGLVAEPISGGEVSIQGYGTYCYVGVGADVPPLAIIPGLVRLSELVLHGYGLEASLDELGRSDKPGMAAWPCLPSGITRIMLR